MLLGQPSCRESNQNVESAAQLSLRRTEHLSIVVGAAPQ